jgi:hypothetical protein
MVEEFLEISSGLLKMKNNEIWIEIFESLQPNEGYHLEAMLASTYTFDPLIGLILLTYASRNDVEVQNILEDTPVNKEKIRVILKENLPKTLFIIDGHGVLEGSERLSPYIKVLLHHAVKKPIVDRTKGSFHPKLILTIYSNKDEIFEGKLYIGSRNLSKSTMKEFGVVLELKQDKKDSQLNLKLIEFLEDLKQNELGQSKYKVDTLEKIIYFVKEKKLCTTNKEISLAWQSRFKKESAIARQIPKIVKGDWKEAHINSLWVRELPIDWLIAEFKPSHIKIHCLKENGFKYKNQANIQYQFEKHGELRDRMQWHYKTILFRNAEKSVLVFGSPNFTIRGLGLGHQLNTEIALVWPAKKNDFSYLMIDASNLEEGIDLSKEKTEIDESDKIQEELEKFSINLEYIKKDGVLKYEIIGEWKLKYPFKIFHHLIENLETRDGPIDKHLVCHNSTIRSPYSLYIQLKDLYLVSPLIRLEVERNGKIDRLDIIVDLPDIFTVSQYNLSNLKCLSLNTQEVLAALLDIQGEPIPPLKNIPNSPEGRADELQKTLDYFSKHVSLEKLSFRLARCRNQDYRLFESRMKRLENIIDDLENIKDKPISKFVNFDYLRDALKEIINVIKNLP